MRGKGELLRCERRLQLARAADAAESFHSPGGELTQAASLRLKLEATRTELTATHADVEQERVIRCSRHDAETVREIDVVPGPFLEGSLLTVMKIRAVWFSSLRSRTRRSTYTVLPSGNVTSVPTGGKMSARTQARVSPCSLRNRVPPVEFASSTRKGASVIVSCYLIVIG